MICPSCVIGVIIVIGGDSIVIIIGVVCVQLSHKQFWSQKLYILQIYSSISLIYAHKILSQCDAYFLSGGHFSKYIYLALLSTWLNLEPLYLAQLCIYTGATYGKEIIYLSIIFLELRIFKKFYILHLFGSLAKMPKILSL